MVDSNIIDFYGGVLAYREYSAELSGGSWTRFAVTLADSAVDTPGAQFARNQDALAFGFVLFLDGPPTVPDIVWVVSGTHLTLATSGGDWSFSDELREIIGLHLELFFEQLRPLAPKLADALLGLPCAANDNDDDDRDDGDDDAGALH